MVANAKLMKKRNGTSRMATAKGRVHRGGIRQGIRGRGK